MAPVARTEVHQVFNDVADDLVFLVVRTTLDG